MLCGQIIGPCFIILSRSSAVPSSFCISIKSDKVTPLPVSAEFTNTFPAKYVNESNKFISYFQICHPVKSYLLNLVVHFILNFSFKFLIIKRVGNIYNSTIINSEIGTAITSIVDPKKCISR